MFDHHGFCELDIFVFHCFYNDSGAIGWGPGEVEANPRGDGTRPWGAVGVPPPRIRILGYGSGSQSRRRMTQRVGGF